MASRIRMPRPAMTAMAVHIPVRLLQCFIRQQVALLGPTLYLILLVILPLLAPPRLLLDRSATLPSSSSC